jgi:hypothetical protein
LVSGLGDTCAVPGDARIQFKIVLQIVLQGIPSMGLELKESKSELTIFGDDETQKAMILEEFRAVCPSISVTEKEDLLLLGPPSARKLSRPY